MKINDLNLRIFSRLVAEDVPAYIEEHSDEYENYLKESIEHQGKEMEHA